MRAGQGFCGERNNCLIQAVTEFPEDYTQSVIKLQSVAPNCLHQSQSPKFELPDGSSRRTFGLESGDGADYPGCLRTEIYPGFALDNRTFPCMEATPYRAFHAC